MSGRSFDDMGFSEDPGERARQIEEEKRRLGIGSDLPPHERPGHRAPNQPPHDPAIAALAALRGHDGSIQGKD